MSRIHQTESGWAGDHWKYWHNVENHKRRRALPPLPSMPVDAKFFDRLLSSRKVQELVFITKAVARNR